MAKKELQNKQVKMLKLQGVFCVLLHLVCLVNSESLFAQTALPGVAAGRIERIENFTSRFTGSRCIDVCNTPHSSDQKYGLLS